MPWLSSILDLQMLPSSFLLSSGVNANPTLKLVSVCTCSLDSRRVPDHETKRVIMPIFVPLRPKKWFNDRSLFSDDLSSFVISGRDFFKRGGGGGGPPVLL
jgi:hypothetical protein